MSPDLERGRAEYRRHAWASAYEALARADRASTLLADDLEQWALTAYFTGRDREYVALLKRAYQAHLAGQAPVRGARAAFWLGLRLLLRGEVGQANGWFGRARRLLDRERRDCVERGYLLIGSAQAELDAGDLEGAFATAASAADLGERFGDADLVATAQHLMGLIRLRAGRIREGLSLLDEAMIAVAGGELSPMVTGLIYCSVIDGCQQVYALARAHEWTAALADWCAQQPEMVAFTGICGVHRAELFQLRGDWARALEEAERSTARGLETGSSTAGAALYQQGEIRRLRGELKAAEEAYTNASRLGCDPQPGLALLRLSQGRVSAAARSIRRSLAAEKDGLRRARLLPAFVEIMLANRHLEESRAASRELGQLAERLGSPILQALADHAAGSVELASGDRRPRSRPCSALGRSARSTRCPTSPPRYGPSWVRVIELSATTKDMRSRRRRRGRYSSGWAAARISRGWQPWRGSRPPTQLGR